MALTPEQRRLLTPKQRRLCTEIEDIASMVDTDHWKILDYKPSARTSRLEVAKNRLIRGHVIAMYTFVDQLLTLAIWRYYFYESSKKKPLTQRWRMKKFRTFHHLMEATSLQRKLDIVRAIRNVPGHVVDAIYRINGVRNALAHLFYPEKGQKYWKHKKVMYGGKVDKADIFSKEGVEKFEQDCERVEAHLWRRAFGKPSRVERW